MTKLIISTENQEDFENPPLIHSVEFLRLRVPIGRQFIEEQNIVFHVGCGDKVEWIFAKL